MQNSNFEEKKQENNKNTNLQPNSINMVVGKLPFLDYGENMVTSSDGLNQQYYHQGKPSNSGVGKVDGLIAQKAPAYPTPPLNDTLESPYSPNDGYEDLFDMTPGKKSPKVKAKKPVKAGKGEVFDALFGSASPVAMGKAKEKKKHTHKHKKCKSPKKRRKSFLPPGTAVRCRAGPAPATPAARPK